jgi:hypothetical protein
MEVKWSMNNEKCRCNCTMRTVIQQLHLHCSLFMDHVTFTF